jgi:Selenocysteine lyase
MPMCLPALKLALRPLPKSSVWEGRIEWLNRVGLDEIRQHESKLVEYALKRLAEIPQVKVLGNPKERGALLSVTLDGIAVSDAAMILDEKTSRCAVATIVHSLSWTGSASMPRSASVLAPTRSNAILTGSLPESSAC